MAKVFILEDNPRRVELFRSALIGHDVTCVDNVDDARESYRGPYDVVLLDHDLGGDTYVPSECENTGYVFAKHLADCDAKSLVIVHSMNQAGASRMVTLLRPRAVWAPFNQELLDHLREYLGIVTTQLA